MDIPLLLLLALPFLTIAVVVAVSRARRTQAGRHAAASGPVHRFQSDSAAVQAAAAARPAARTLDSGRVRRAASGGGDPAS